MFQARGVADLSGPLSEEGIEKPQTVIVAGISHFTALKINL